METTRSVPLGDIKTHPGLQPRDTTLLSARDRVRQDDQSELHVRDMAELLKADPRAELVPVELADIGGTLYVVDGHHRLKAYRRARRSAAPARVRAMTWHEASHASKLANLSLAKMEMRPAQKRNALWHHLAFLTDFGARSLPEEVALKKTAGHFGVSRNTLRSMIRRLPEVDPKAYPGEQRDAITGWPHWKAVSTEAGAMYQAMQDATRDAWRARKCAEALIRLRERWGADALLDGAALLLAEAKDPEALQDASELAHAVAEVAVEGLPGDF